MQLVDLLNKANKAYPDNYLSEYFNENTGECTTPIAGDTFARFIVKELQETFEPTATDEQQIAVASRVLCSAARTLLNVSIAVGVV